jgi:ATP-binding cassette subfamily B multidrug efflux pump
VGVSTVIPHIKQLFSYIVPYRWHFLWASFCLAATNFFMVQIPEEIGHAIDGIATGQSLPSIINIAWMGALVIMVRSMSRIFFFNPARDVEYCIRRDLFAHLLALPSHFYATFNRGDIVSRASNDIMWVRIMVGFGGLQIVNLVFALSLTGWKMFAISTPLSIASLIPIGIGFVIVNIAISQLHPMMKKNQEELAKISDHVLESFQSVSTIQGFQAEEAFEKRFSDQNQQWFSTGLRLAFWQSIFTPILALSSGGAIFALIYVGAPLVQEGSVTIGQLAAFIALIASLLPFMRSIGWMLSVWHRGYAAWERILEILNTPLERPEGDTPVDIPNLKKNKISFKNLSFSYPEEPEKMILQNISAEIEPGSMIGIFGRTGSGKTTLLRLLSRIYNPAEGMVFVGSEDIRTFDIEKWHTKLAVVPQRPFLFSESIHSNISLQDTGVEEQVQEAIRLASLDQDITSFEAGLDTIVGERGIMLSGGQRQRVALARGLFKEASLILLDDVLSAVDHENESKLVATLYQLSQTGVTCFIVSNRVSAFRYAHNILVLEDGHLVKQGKHEELIHQEGLYQDTYNAQKEG